MVNEPYVDPPRPPTEEQRRMLIEAGRDFDMWGTQRYTSETVRYSGPVVYAEGGLIVWKVVQDLSVVLGASAILLPGAGSYGAPCLRVIRQHPRNVRDTAEGNGPVESRTRWFGNALCPGFKRRWCHRTLTYRPH